MIKQIINYLNICVYIHIYIYICTRRAVQEDQHAVPAAELAGDPLFHRLTGDLTNIIIISVYM